MPDSVPLAIDTDALEQSTQTLLSSGKYVIDGKGRGCYCKRFEKTALLKTVGY